MDRYSKYFLQHILSLDDGFNRYYVQDKAWGRQEILDVESVVFDWDEDAEQWLSQCADHDRYSTISHLRSFLSNDCSELYHVHLMTDRQIMHSVARQMTQGVYQIVIKPRLGWAVQIDADGAGPALPLRVEPEPDLDRLLSGLKQELNDLVAEQRQKSEQYESQMRGMNTAQKALFVKQQMDRAAYDTAIGDNLDLIKAAPGVIWSAAKAFPGFYKGYLKLLWKIAQIPGKMAGLTAQAVATGDINPLKKEIDKIVNPVAATYEQAMEYKSMLTILCSEPEVYELLYDFADRYYDATHPIELAQMGTSAVTEVLVTVLLAIITAGAGAAANMAAKSGKLVKVFKLLKRITATIKKISPNTKLLDRSKNVAKKAKKTRKAAAKRAKGIPDIDSPKKTKKLEKSSKKEYDGPKKTTRLDSRHTEVSQGIAKRIGKSSPAQTSGDIDQLFKQAKVADVELKKLTDDIASSTNGKAVYPPGLKTKARAIEKINADYGGDASKLLDISRSSISFESADDLYKALDKIDKKAEIVRIKDRFVKPAPGGYRDILVNIKQPNGHITELQLHSKQILDVKGGTGHKLYEQIREINGKAILENRPLSASELKLQNSLIKESEALYDDAFKGFLGK